MSDAALPRTCLICKFALDEEMRPIRGNPSRVFCSRVKDSATNQPVGCESERLGITAGQEAGRCGESGVFWEKA